MFKNLNYIPNYFPEDIFFYNFKKPSNYVFMHCRPAYITFYKNFYNENILESNPFLDILYKIMTLRNKIYSNLIFQDLSHSYRSKSTEFYNIHLMFNNTKEVLRNIEEYNFLRSKDIKYKNNNFYTFSNKIYLNLYNKHKKNYDILKKNYSIYENDNISNNYFNLNIYKLYNDSLFSELYLLNNSNFLILKLLNINKLDSDKNCNSLNFQTLLHKQYLDYNFISNKKNENVNYIKSNWTLENELVKYTFYKNKIKILIYNLHYSNLIKNLPTFINPFYSYNNKILNLDLNPFLLNLYINEDPQTCFIPENLSIFHIFTNFNFIKLYFYENPVLLFREILIFKSKYNLQKNSCSNLNLDDSLEL
jgi:hypothetical protein